jgi:hypothetical protein
MGLELYPARSTGRTGIVPGVAKAWIMSGAPAPLTLRQKMNDDNRAVALAHEDKMLRRLRFLVDLTTALIAQDDSLSLEQGWEHVRALKAAAVAMFPGKEDVFDLIYLPRFSRLLAERFGAN